MQALYACGKRDASKSPPFVLGHPLPLPQSSKSTKQHWESRSRCRPLHTGGREALNLLLQSVHRNEMPCQALPLIQPLPNFRTKLLRRKAMALLDVESPLLRPWTTDRRQPISQEQTGSEMSVLLCARWPILSRPKTAIEHPEPAQVASLEVRKSISWKGINLIVRRIITHSIWTKFKPRRRIRCSSAICPIRPSQWKQWPFRSLRAITRSWLCRQ